MIFRTWAYIFNLAGRCYERGDDYGIKKASVWVVRIFCLLFFELLVSSASHAGITLDGTMGAKGPLAGPQYTITSGMGQQMKGNLFHSFSTFNVNKWESATFTGPSSILNIISRVTGGNPSSIDGLVRSTIQGANFYFIMAISGIPKFKTTL
jgi:filamentous hemagglutinin family protein